MDGFVRDDGAERILEPLSAEGMEPVGWRREEESRKGAKAQRNRNRERREERAMDGFVRDDGAERILEPLSAEGMEPVGWRRVEESRRGAEAQREEGEALGMMPAGEWVEALADAAGVSVERMAEAVRKGREKYGRGRVWPLLQEGVGELVEHARELAAVVGGDGEARALAERAREVGVMGNARKLGLGRRAALFDVVREVEAEVLASAAREPVMERRPGVSMSALRIATDLDNAVMMGDWVDVRRVAINMAVEVIRLAGEAGKRE